MIGPLWSEDYAMYRQRFDVFRPSFFSRFLRIFLN